MTEPARLGGRLPRLDPKLHHFFFVGVSSADILVIVVGMTPLVWIPDEAGGAKFDSLRVDLPRKRLAGDEVAVFLVLFEVGVFPFVRRASPSEESGVKGRYVWAGGVTGGRYELGSGSSSEESSKRLLNPPPNPPLPGPPEEEGLAALLFLRDPLPKKPPPLFFSVLVLIAFRRSSSELSGE